MPYNHLEPRIKLMFLVNLISISSFSLEHIGLDNCCRIFRDRFSTNKINLLKNCRVTNGHRSELYSLSVLETHKKSIRCANIM